MLVTMFALCAITVCYVLNLTLCLLLLQGYLENDVYSLDWCFKSAVFLSQCGMCLVNIINA